MNDSAQNREHYRLRYPLLARPCLLMQQKEFTVTEISESGCKIVAAPDLTAPFDSDVKGVFRFHDGTLVHTVVSYLRLNDDEVVLQLSPSIPLPAIMAEQRWLLKQYPKESLK